MVRQVKAEVRIAFISIVRLRNRRVMSMIIYRAGYIEDIEFHEIKEEKDCLDIIINSRHSKQIRYVVFNAEAREIMPYIETFPLPVILLDEEPLLNRLEKHEYDFLESKGYIKDGLNICKIISKLIKHYDKVLPKVRQSAQARKK
ncbi:MAG TPA: hypothetical protein VKU94_06275 [Geobacterales bacterium]|nr:hypothetical protein [Geobacterales bacterium]